MSLKHMVRVSPRFQRSIKIDSDIGLVETLNGFVCPQSSSEILISMSRHIAETGQSAFTWTGPYGSGKSSLVVALSGLLSSAKSVTRKAARALGKEATKSIRSSMFSNDPVWTVVPVVGRRDDPAKVIGEAFESAGLAELGKAECWTDDLILSVLEKAIGKNAGNPCVAIFVDEMGKFLEGAAHHGGDIYLFQQLAELACRSEGKLVVVGILHQAFEEYASRISRDMRDEWSKIQGRFVDLPLNTAGEEQIELISRAIESDQKPTTPSRLSSAVTDEVQKQRPDASPSLSNTLEACWPLHPVVACLLGPISRRRFGQNQRSVFGFLNSAEPFGFQDYLKRAFVGERYEPQVLWDYLRTNLEPSILASPDGHRWALAAEAVDRCEAMGGEDLHIHLVKAIALLDLFKERSGLLPTKEVLQLCVDNYKAGDVRKALDQLQAWSFVIYRKFNSSFTIYAGSDFDIEGALEDALANVSSIDFKQLAELSGIQPLLAKRHYHETGALRWFDVEIASLGSLYERVSEYQPKNGAIGQFLLALPTEGEDDERAKKLCREAARAAKDWDAAIGISKSSWQITTLAREVIALDQIRDESPELDGDAVARREILARLASTQANLGEELLNAFDSAIWHIKHFSVKAWSFAELNGIASELADRKYSETPRLHNELLNRVKPSGNAVAAQNILLRRMVTEEGQMRLGIDGFPAEGGLFASLLEATGLYAEVNGTWRIIEPGNGHDDPARLRPLWDAAIKLLEGNADRSISVDEIYNIWRRPPFGLKEGLMPVLAVALILSRRDKIALYRQGIFQARFKDLDAEYLARDSADIQLRWMDLSDISRQLLSAMAEIVRDLQGENVLSGVAPIDVARGLIAIYDQLPSWTHRTTRLSANATKIRSVFKQASDPNKFLFDDLPRSIAGDAALPNEKKFKEFVDDVGQGLREITEAYPAMLARLRDTLLVELQVPNTSPQSLKELRERAKNIRQLAGDFRLDAFAGRLGEFRGTDTDIEGIASLAANKPAVDWADPDLDRVTIEIADLAQRFIRAETFARVKGRPDKRQSMAVVVGLNGRPGPIIKEFDVTDADREAIDNLIARLDENLTSSDPSQRNVILAALAELSARYMHPDTRHHDKKTKEAALA